MTAEDDVLLSVVEAIAEVDGVEPHELEYALHDHVYTEALRGLVEGGYSDWELSFRVPDHEVTLRADDGIYVDGELVRTFDEQFDGGE